MTTQTEAERLADYLTDRNRLDITCDEAAAELRRLVSFNSQLMDEVARLNKAVADEREACAKVCDDWAKTSYLSEAKSCAKIIRARGNI
jgi:hypothetical protein